ncbi:F(420)H(2) dehydrogenase subunit H [uncultured archaeon]|nr:F(420)H(2) dehydrogenase subunit H [uncultured archaeon]
MSTGDFVLAAMQISAGASGMAAALSYALTVLLLIVAFDYAFGWAERKVIAKIQARHGPTYVGRFGLLQNLADIIKLLSKEHAVPQKASSALFTLVMPLMLGLSIFLVLLVPFSPDLLGPDLGMGALVVFVLLSFMPLMAFVGGISSGNKFSSIGAQRSALMLMAYELPAMVVLASVGALAGSYGFLDIINAQALTNWFAFTMPLGFVVFFVAMLAELERPPFDMREADSELVAGWLTDVSAPYFGLALFVDYTRMFLGSLVMAILFLGGWAGPVLPPIAWLLLKAFAISFAIIIVRATTARMKLDRLLRLGWVALLPLAILNLIITFMIFMR